MWQLSEGQKPLFVLLFSFPEPPSAPLQRDHCRYCAGPTTGQDDQTEQERSPPRPARPYETSPSIYRQTAAYFDPKAPAVTQRFLSHAAYQFYQILSTLRRHLQDFWKIREGYWVKLGRKTPKTSARLGICLHKPNINSEFSLLYRPCCFTKE